jgi:hypothetical protein
MELKTGGGPYCGGQGCLSIFRGTSILMSLSDVSNSCVRHLEHGRSMPTFVNLLKLADALDLDLAVLLRTARRAVGGKRPKAKG